MRHVLKASIQTAVLLSLVGVSTGVAGTYYTQRLLQTPRTLRLTACVRGVL